MCIQEACRRRYVISGYSAGGSGTITLTWSKHKKSGPRVSQSDILDEVKKCLAFDPIYGKCIHNKYGSIADWDVSGITSAYDASSDCGRKSPRGHPVRPCTVELARPCGLAAA